MKKIYIILAFLMAFSANALEEDNVKKAKDNVEKSLPQLTYKSLDNNNKGFNGLSIGQMKELLKASGFTAIKSRMDKDNIMQFDAKSNAAQFVIQGDNCQGSGGKQICEYFEIFAYFKDSKNPYDLDLINEWNKDQRWTKAYLTTKGEAVITQELHPVYVTAASLLYQLQAWQYSLEEFQYHIHWK